MQIFKEIAPLKAFLVEKRSQGKTIGFVATMGALHEGHLELIRHSRNDNSLTVCSIFVNPSQFNNPADLQKYPRTLESDIEKLERAACDVLFCPDAHEMYERQSILRFDFGHLDKVMEGEFRPGHFSGVALVVSKLFNIVEPHVAYFGQKDWQQFTVIQQLTHELKFNLTLKSIPTFRETNGLAMSSRNALLSAETRQRAGILYQSLTAAADHLRQGISVYKVKAEVKKMIEAEPGFTVEYIEVADSENLKPVNNVTESVNPILCIAVFAGEVRLIDNMLL